MDVRVKEEPQWVDYSEGASEAASQVELYFEHEIKEEVVVGPEIIQPPDILQTIATEKYSQMPRKIKKKCTKQGATHVLTKKYICEICQKYFEQENQLRKHECTDWEEQFKCPICNKQFKHKSSLHSHKFVHVSRRPFSCRYCPKSFKLKGTMITHQRMHTGYKPYSCDICNREFTQQTSLNNHKLLHKGIKPYPCPNCPKKFTQISNLRQHLSKFHPEQNEIVTSPYFSKKKVGHFGPIVLKFKTFLKSTSNVMAPVFDTFN